MYVCTLCVRAIRKEKRNPLKVGNTGCRPGGMSPSPDRSVPPRNFHPEHVPPVQCCAMTFSFIRTAILSRSGILRFARANQQRRASSAAPSSVGGRYRYGDDDLGIRRSCCCCHCVRFITVSRFRFYLIYLYTYIHLYTYTLFFFYERRFRFFACSCGTLRRARC